MKKIMFNDNFGLTKAVLEGRKTMTRRIIPEKYGNVLKHYEKGVLVVPLSCIPDDMSIEEFAEQWNNAPSKIRFVPVKEEAEQPQVINCLDSMLKAAKLDSRYKMGEEIAISQSYSIIGIEILNGKPGESIYDAYRNYFFQESDKFGWENKMYVRADLMPHRIRITDIKVEHLQDITEEDCMREGIEWCHGSQSYYVNYIPETGFRYWLRGKTAREAFAFLIDKISGKGTWDKNPYVFAYTFELVQ